MKGIEGKRVIVTAGARGIGKSIAASYLNLGAKVAICDIDEISLNEIQQDFPSLLTACVDMSSLPQTDSFFDIVESQFGGIDIVINNAGISGPTGNIEDITLKDWKTCLSVNIDSLFLTARRCVPLMKQQQAGSIVNIASTAGLFAYPKRAPYAASKWAMIGLTKTLAMECGEFGIRVNAIAPGSINNERMDGVISREALLKKSSEQEIRELYVKQTALRTFIDPVEIADMAIFLTSDLGKNISGQVIAVDGFAETLVN